jgi:hypothetical protein
MPSGAARHWHLARCPCQRASVRGGVGGVIWLRVAPSVVLCVLLLRLLQTHIHSSQHERHWWLSLAGRSLAPASPLATQTDYHTLESLNRSFPAHCAMDMRVYVCIQRACMLSLPLRQHVQAQELWGLRTWDDGSRMDVHERQTSCGLQRLPAQTGQLKLAG